MFKRNKELFEKYSIPYFSTPIHIMLSIVSLLLPITVAYISLLNLLPILFVLSCVCISIQTISREAIFRPFTKNPVNIFLNILILISCYFNLNTLLNNTYIEYFSKDIYFNKDGFYLKSESILDITHDLEYTKLKAHKDFVMNTKEFKNTDLELQKEIVKLLDIDIEQYKVNYILNTGKAYLEFTKNDLIRLSNGREVLNLLGEKNLYQVPIKNQLIDLKDTDCLSQVFNTLISEKNDNKYNSLEDFMKGEI